MFIYIKRKKRNNIYIYIYKYSGENSGAKIDATCGWGARADVPCIESKATGAVHLHNSLFDIDLFKNIETATGGS